MAQDTDQVEYTPEHPPSIQGVLQESQKHLHKTYPDTCPKQELPHEQQQQDILDMGDAKDGDLLRCLTQKLAQTSILCAPCTSSYVCTQILEAGN